MTSGGHRNWFREPVGRPMIGASERIRGGREHQPGEIPASPFRAIPMVLPSALTCEDDVKKYAEKVLRTVAAAAFAAACTGVAGTVPAMDGKQLVHAEPDGGAAMAAPADNWAWD